MVTEVATETGSGMRLNSTSVAPDRTVAEAGTHKAEGLELDSETVAPLDPAAALRVMLPTPDRPELTRVAGVIDRPVRTAATGLTVTVEAELTPPYAAVKVTAVEAVTLPVVTLKVADAEPCGTVTDAGAPAMEALELEIDMVAPPVPAAAVRLTVPVPDCPLVMEAGFTEMLLRAPGRGLTVTPEVALTPK
jgi:hypothetical protein